MVGRLNYSSRTAVLSWRELPTYADLMSETDGQASTQLSATESQFRTLSEIEKNNAIVPSSATFRGPKALRAVGSYLGSTRQVSAFSRRTSNVSLQQADDWKKF